jgi:hypothetical protein
MYKPSHERIRYLKFIAKNGFYEKCVRHSGYFGYFELQEFLSRVQIEISSHEIKLTKEEAIEIIGYYPGKWIFKIECFARIRTDRQRYPEYGVCGIPDQRKSRFGQYFESKMKEGIAKREEILWQQRLAKLKKEQNKRIEKIYRKSRLSKTNKYSDQFFILAGAAEALANLQPTNQTK